MSIFEIVMLVCFGAAWPFALYQSYTSRRTAGKSVAFLYIVLAGYAAGIMHKLLYNLDFVIWLYMANGIMVLAEIALYYRNLNIEKYEQR